MSIKFVEVKPISKIKLDNPYMIIGFPGAGLIGSIAGAYLTSKEFELVGYIESEKLAPVAAVHDYKPLPPIRLMVSKNKNMVVLLSESSIPLSLSLPLSNFILDIAKKLKVKAIISIGGMAKVAEKRKSYVICSTENAWELAEKAKLGERIKEGATTGISALLLTKANLENIDMIALLIETGLEVGDPKASSIALKLVSRFTNTKINVSKLEKEAKEYEAAEKASIFGNDESMYR